MGRQQAKLPNTDEGHEERLRRAVELTRRVLQCDMAQDPSAPDLGMMLYATMQLNRKTGETSVVNLRHDTADRAMLQLAAVYARPFTLNREAVYGPDVAKSIRHFASVPEQRRVASQIEDMWKKQPFNRIYTSKLINGVEVTPAGGLGNGTVADRFLYARLLHADDASEVLDHITEEDQMWSLAGLVGDWLALISHQEAFISWVRPDISPKLTSWSGDHTTIFKRLGIPRPDDDRHDVPAEEPKDAGSDSDRPALPYEHSES